MFNDVAYLLGESETTDEYMNTIKAYTKRKVFCQPRSIGMREFYAAQQTDLRPSVSLVLADYGDYQGEKRCIYGDDMYDVVRTYRNGTRLELTLQIRSGHKGDEAT